MNLLESSRENIDRIDHQLIQLIKQRIDAAHEIGRRKGADTESFLRDIEREREVFERWAGLAEEHGLSSHYVGRILRELLNYSRRVQEGYLDQGTVRAGLPVTRVGYQGVTNSYSYLALQRLFACREGTSLKPIGMRSFGAVVDALLANDIDYALLPIENTIAGSLNEVYQLLAERQISIVDEEIWHVEHCLAALPSAQLDDIRRIRSHSVALQQCTEFLGKMTGASAEVYYNTAAAAESLLADNDRSIAAICSVECATSLGLNILKRQIADHLENYTRFVLVSREPEDADRRQPCKTSLQFTVAHRDGALAEVLQAFARHQVSLSKLESRPQPSEPWEYLFYVDLIGHQDDSAVAAAIDEARSLTNQLRVLGSYPRRSHEHERRIGDDK